MFKDKITDNGKLLVLIITLTFILFFLGLLLCDIFGGCVTGIGLIIVSGIALLFESGTLFVMITADEFFDF